MNSSITDGDIRNARRNASKLHKDTLMTGEIDWESCVKDLCTETLELREEIRSIKSRLREML